jgi:hypothetical protein
MAVAQAEYTSSQTDTVLVSGVADKIIVVLRVLFTAEAAVKFKLQSDPGGANETDMTPLVYCSAVVPFDCRLGRHFGLATERGKSLGFTSSFDAENEDHSIIIWYEVVD